MNMGLVEVLSDWPSILGDRLVQGADRGILEADLSFGSYAQRGGSQTR